MAHFKNLVVDGDIIIKGTLTTDQWLPGQVTVKGAVVPDTITVTLEGTDPKYVVKRPDPQP